MSLLFNVCPSLTETNEESSNISSTIDLDDGSDGHTIDLDNDDTRPVELVEYVEYEEKISILQEKFNVSYERFLYIYGAKAYDDKKLLNDVDGKRSRLRLKKMEIDLVFLRVEQRELLYQGRCDSDGLVDCKSFINQKMKMDELTSEVAVLKKILEEKG
ncbi:hypothetical protein ABG067_007753, partial [Albugo candida]